MIRSNVSASSGPISRAFAFTSEGWATAKERLGANLASSDFQFAISEAGTTSRLGLVLLVALQIEQQRNHLDRLAEAHVVGQAGAQPQANDESQPGVARLLIGAKLRLQVGRGRLLPGLRRTQALENRIQFRAGGQARPFANRRLRSRPRPPWRGSPRKGDAFLRRTKCPPRRTSLSTSFQCSRASCNFSRSTSTHLPFNGTRPPLDSSN